MDFIFGVKNEHVEGRQGTQGKELRKCRGDLIFLCPWGGSQRSE